MKRKNTLLACSCLLGVGLLGLGIRHSLPTSDNLPRGDQAWLLTLQLQVQKPLTKTDPLILTTPQNTENSRIIKQIITHPGWRSARRSSLEVTKEGLVFFSTQKRVGMLTAEFLVQNSTLPRWKNNSRFVENQDPLPNIEEQPNTQITEIVNRLRGNSGSQKELAQALYNFVYETILLDNSVTTLDLNEILKRKKANTQGKTRLFVALCQNARLPARMTIGFILEEDLDAKIHYWANLAVDGKWKHYDLERGISYAFAKNYLPFSYHDDRLAYSLEQGAIDVDVQIVPETLSTGLFNRGKPKLTDLVDLTRLPVQTQTIVAALLLLPLGVLITVFYVQILGIKTFGTFTPAFIAMALLFTETITIGVILVIVILFGILGLIILPKTIDRLPRLSMVFVITVLSVVLGVSFLDFFELSNTGFIVLLPVVILTSLVDTSYKVVDQKGLPVGLLRTLWSLVVISSCVIVFQQTWLSYWFLTYPEAHFITLAVILYLANLKGNPKWVQRKPFLYLLESNYDTNSTTNRAQLKLDL